MTLRKAAATNSNTTAKAPTAKAPITKATATKAPAKKAPTKATPSAKLRIDEHTPCCDGTNADCTCKVTNGRMDSLADMIRGQQVTIDSLVTQCELLERIIVGIQTARIAAPAPAPAPTAKAPAPKAPAKDKAPNVERGTYDGPAVDGPVADVLDYLADCIIANEAAGFVNENIMRANPARMRRYLRTNENKAFKAMREAHDITLTLADDMLDSIFVA